MGSDGDVRDVRIKLYSDFKNALAKLIDQATASRHIDEENVHLLALCDVLCSILSHGFIEKRGWYKSKTVWDFLDETLRKYPSVPGTDNLLVTDHFEPYALLGIHRISLFKTGQWYSPWALIMTNDEFTPITGMLQGLNQLEFNFYLKGESQGRDVSSGIAANLFSKGDDLIKSGIAATFTTIENLNKSGLAASLQTKMELVKLEKINQGLTSANNKLGEQLTAAHETIKQLNRSHEDLARQLDSLQRTLESERRLRLSLEIDLVSISLSRDKDVTDATQYVGELERRYQETKDELAESLRAQADLNAQLERARLVARVAKA
ncbi:hypothetical protein HK104_003715, partial [Borealophlyctis nickersoniae]